MYFIENVSYKHAVRVQFIGYRDVLFWGVFLSKEQEKLCNFYSSLLQMLDETSVYSKDEVRQESRPAWERHTGGDDCGGVQELNGT